MQHRDPAQAELRLLTKTELCRMLATSEASIDRWLRTDRSFPQARRLGPGSIRWIRQEVVEFIRNLEHAVYDDHAFDPANKHNKKD